jgi:hypothetical protein
LEYNAELAIPNSWIRTRESAETGLEILPQRRSLSIMRGAKAVIERSDPHDAGPFGQILKFEPRRSGQPSFAAATTQPFEDDPGDFARFEQAQDEPIDYRHRMIMNLIALAILIALVGLGVWIADTISDLQREQDCLMQGRSNCAPIEVPIPVQE